MKAATRLRERRAPSRRRATTSVPALFALGLLLLAPAARPVLANGGTVRISRAPVGPWLVTVYSSPTPLWTGRVDISTLVQDSADRVMDVPVVVTATPVGFPAPPVVRAATRAQATNKLFKAAKFDIEVPGTWEFTVSVGRGDGAADGGAGADRMAAGAIPGAGGPEPGGAVSFRAAVTERTILDRPLVLGALVLLPVLVLAWVLRGRSEPTGDRTADG